MADYFSKAILIQMSSESCSPEESLKYITSILPQLEKHIQNSPTRPLICTSEDVLLIKVVHNALRCSAHRELSVQLLSTFKDSSTTDFLIRLLHTSESRSSETEKNEVIEACVELLEHLHSCMPSFILQLQGLIFTLEKTVEKTPKLSKLTRRILSVKEAVKRSIEFTQKRKTTTTEHVDKRKPPEDFRNLPIFPRREDIFPEQRPFLRKIIKDGKYEDLEHYLDVQFRLFREDCIAQLRSGIQEYIKEHTAGNYNIRRLESARIYDNVRILFRETSLDGILHVLQLDEKTYENIDWSNTKRLLHGSLVCLSFDHFETFLFATIMRADADVLSVRGLFKVKVNLTGIELHDRMMGRLCTMIESTALFEAYRHGLEKLKSIRAGKLAFEKFFVRCETEIGKTDYFEKDSMFDFTSITNKSLVKILRYGERNDRTKQIRDWPSSEELHMNPIQYEAFKAALTNEFCLIQGPPGTGKSYLGIQIVKALLANTRCWSRDRTSPILMICFTNHALDQFLENIVDSVDETSKSRIVRVGGRSSNKVIEDISLKKRCGRVPKKRRLLVLNLLQNMISKCRKMISQQTFTILDHGILRKYIDFPSQNFTNQEEKTIFRWLNVDKRGILDTASNINGMKRKAGINKYLETENNLPNNGYENVFYQLTSSVDESEHEDPRIRDSPVLNFGMNILHTWRTLSVDKTVNEDKTFLKKVELVIDDILRNINLENTMTAFDADFYETQNLWDLPMSERWNLYRLWQNRFYRKILSNIEDYETYHDEILQSYRQEVFNNEYRVLERAALIAMTTTGAAKYQTMLELLRPRIIIIDEAAEVLEAHIVSSLTSSCEHLIMIGDHKQLEPKPAVFELAQKYHLSLSFFERMIRNGVSHHCLLKQHRMRPEISSLVKEIYPGLHDAENVKEYDNVGGIASNVFFLSHGFKEEYKEEGRSYENYFEAEFTARLCRYLIRQGYIPSQITVLTPYSGQLRCLTGLKDKITKDVRFCIVDNYQGEENDIILLSLVRSNDIGKLGFLDKENRVCVALSRAKRGLFVIGNFEMMRTCAKKTRLWDIIIKDLELKNCYGTELPLFCQNHPERKIKAKHAEDFNNCPDGGCKAMCETRLSCGHACRRYCHPDDKNHKSYKCKDRCSNMCINKHTCEKLCHFPEPCNCTVLINKEFRCGHENAIQCCMDPKDEECCTVITKYFSTCFHSIELACPKPVDKVNCEKIVEQKLICGHKMSLPCHRRNSKNKCIEFVEKTWSCGHSAFIECAEFDRAKCTKQVVRKSKCGHENAMECHYNINYFECNHVVEKQFKKCRHIKRVPCNRNMEYEICKEPVFLKRNCSHEVKSECFKIDGDREKICETVCGRTCENQHKCRRLCHFPEKCNCRQLVQKLIPTCGHVVIMECCEDPCRFDCNEMVEKKVPGCRHSVLLECSNTMVDFSCSEKTKKYRPSCGHIVSTECCKDPEVAFCDALVSRSLECGHVGEFKCSEINIRCMKKVTDFLSCGHEAEINCYQKNFENPVCMVKLEYILECGHFYPLLCSEFQRGEGLEEIKCTENIDTTMPCGHINPLRCGSDILTTICTARCDVTLSCGHGCSEICGNCFKKGYHNRCTEFCRKQMLCGHECDSDLCESCKTCKRKCEVFCDHKRCEKNCFEVCDPCIMQCSWKCPHYDCTLLCHEICDRPRCAFPCPKKLQCKHECLGFCGEPCPPCCLLCDSKTLQAYAEEKNVRLVYLPDCKHFFEFSFLDNAIKEMAPNESLMFLFCPKCKTNIYWHPRYNKIIKLQRKRRNLAKAITVYVSEAKGWEYFPLFFPSFLHCQKLIENCVSLLINNMDDPHKDSLIETCDKALTQINSIRTMLRPSFEQYSSVYDVIRKISEDWPMDSKENNLLKTNISDLVENFTKHIGNEIIKRTTENNQVTTNGSIKSPTIFLIADPHAEHWKICKQGIFV